MTSDECARRTGGPNLERTLRLAALPVTLLLSGCAGVQSAMSPFGVEAAATARLTWVMVAGAVLISVAVAALVVRAVRAPEGSLSHSGGMSLILWAGAIGPTIILFGLLITALPMMRQLPVAPNDLTIAVGGEQFWWRVQYRPTGAPPVEDANLVRVPVGRTVRILLTSPDVIHSFWVPGLAGKVDMIPGRTNTLVVRATKAGTYRGQCTEFCGLAHAKMAFDVVAMEPRAFDAWLVQARTPTRLSSPAQAGALTPPLHPGPGLRRGTEGAAPSGQALYTSYGCAGCHAIRGAGGRIGPDLTLLPQRRSLAAATLPLNPATLAAFIRNPQSVKAGVLMPRFAEMSDAEARAIAAYLLEPK
ncbi:cytochrome c oxidase subunit II [Sphingomonas prati]|uniref:Cytochrome aa3 subunit 2 n=1 Tax=Sphingomonas prati TaxID=1843237 RepID=A0A7W9BRD2_9SPHN|nr:cytochrome c oxidase subunit II [Sphingomonas prati]MBB5728729.1 cytochrome c oxidase subunit 2 [Sphingomonas prati]GGE71571.1 cytochrome c oxidase subunit II [Sphingomonas prati]